MKRLSFALTGVIAAMLMAPHAHAQCPLSTIAGTWVFSTDGFTAPIIRVLGSGGRFVASVGVDRAGNPLGVLTITQTTSINGSITRQETDTGRFLLFDDCTGGSLLFNTSSRPVQFDFFLVNPGEMVLVGTDNGESVDGTARLAGPLTCAALPASTINGTWVFVAEGFDLTRLPFPELSVAGRFVSNGGALTVTQTAGVYGGNVRLETVSGRVLVNDDCTGGNLSFAIGARTAQFDFFFSSANRMILSGTTGGDIITGEARRFGTF